MIASFSCYQILKCNIRGEVSLQIRSLGADCLQVSLMSDLVSKVAQAQTGWVTAWFKKKEIKKEPNFWINNSSLALRIYGLLFLTCSNTIPSMSLNLCPGKVKCSPLGSEHFSDFMYFMFVFPLQTWKLGFSRNKPCNSILNIIHGIIIFFAGSSFCIFVRKRWPGGLLCGSPEHYGGPGWRPVNIREVFCNF